MEGDAAGADDADAGSGARPQWRSRALPQYLVIATLARTSFEVIPTGLLVHAALAKGTVALAAHLVAVYTGAAALAGPRVAATAGRSGRPILMVRGALAFIAVAYVVLCDSTSAPAGALYAAAVLVAVCQPVVTSGWSAVLPRLVRTRDRPSAAAWDIVTYCVASAAGPTTASTSVALDPRAPLLIAALLVVLSACATVGLSVPGTQAPKAKAGAAGLARAAVTLARHRRLRQVQVATMLLQGVGSAIVLSAPAVSHSITGGYSAAGVMIACLALGAFGSSVSLGVIRRRPGFPVYWLAALYGAGGIALAWIGVLPIALVVMLAMGSVNGLLLVEVQRLSTLEVPARQRGQVLALTASLRTAGASAATAALSLPVFAAAGQRLVVAGGVMFALCVLLGLIDVFRAGFWHKRGPSDETQVAPGGTGALWSDELGNSPDDETAGGSVGSGGKFVLAVADQSIGAEDDTRALIGDRAEVRYGPLTSDAEAAALSEGADAVIVTLQQLRAPRLAALHPSVRVIGRAGVGLDTIDLTAAEELGVSVVHEPGYCTNEVATHAAALLLSVQRKIGDAAKLMERGWGPVTELGSIPDLSQATLGLVGLGRIGLATAARMAPFVARVIAYDPALAAGKSSGNVEIVESLTGLLAASDLVSLHLPLTDQTRGLISAPELALMRPGSIIVNVSRGPIIDEAALADALRSGHLGGAGLDVFEREPLPADSPLRGVPRLTMTPHIASFSDESAGRMATWTIDDVLALLGGSEPPHGRLVVRGRARADK